MNIKILKEELEHKGITQKELAMKCGINPSTISRIFSGNRDCTVEIAKRIAGELNLSHARATKIFLEA